MSNYPLIDLITRRRFERYRKALNVLCGLHQLDCEVVYCEPTDKSAMYVDLEGNSRIARITVWISGECEVLVLNMDTGDTELVESMTISTDKALFDEIEKLALALRSKDV